jgi:hypothetical protein
MQNREMKGMTLPTWVSQQDYLPGNLIAVNVRPLGSSIPGLDGAITALIETGAVEISGMTSSLRIAYDGRGVPERVVAADATPKFVFQEKFGKTVGAVFGKMDGTTGCFIFREGLGGWHD